MDGRGDWGFVGEDNILGELRVAAKESPVDVRAIADIRVVVLSGGGLEDLLDELLGLGQIGLFEEEFDDGGEDLKLGLVHVSQG